MQAGNEGHCGTTSKHGRRKSPTLFVLAGVQTGLEQLGEGGNVGGHDDDRTARRTEFGEKTVGAGLQRNVLVVALFCPARPTFLLAAACMSLARTPALELWTGFSRASPII